MKTLIRLVPVLVLVVSCAHRSRPPVIATSLDDPGLQRIQREVWEVWFAGDTARLRELTPDLVAVNGIRPGFDDQERAIQGSARFHAAGGRLIELAFPETHVQHFGDVVIAYSTYRTVTVMGRDTTRTTGHATEIFAKQNGHWVNPGWHLDSSQ
jgi:ketosteroid isomerase-like protein